jgi:hypothetical protein
MEYMIWSLPQAQVEATHEYMLEAGKLQPSVKVHDWLAASEGLVHELTPVEYVALPHRIGKLVTPIVTINGDGYLEGTNFYSVASSVDRQKIYAAPTKEGIRGAHALAERTSLSRGIFTPLGRVSSEVAIAEAIPKTFRRFYIDERMGHLAVLTGEVAESDLNPAEQLTVRQQLELAVESLTALRPSR